MSSALVAIHNLHNLETPIFSVLQSCGERRICVQTDVVVPPLRDTIS